MNRISDKQLAALLSDRRFDVPDPHEPWESCPDCHIRYALLELSEYRAKARRHLRVVRPSEDLVD
jgi:hypothetical protein